MVISGEDSPGVRVSLKGTTKVEIVPAAPNWKDLIIEKQIPAAIEIPSGFDKSVVDQKKLEVMIYNYSGDLKSDIVAGKMDTGLKAYRDDGGKKRVVGQKLPVEGLTPFEVTRK